MLKILASAFMSAAVLLSTAGVAIADPGLPNISPHRHFVVTATGDLRQVGPRVCDNPALQDAFNQFHSNVHHAVPGSTDRDAREAAGDHAAQEAEPGCAVLGGDDLARSWASVTVV